MERLNKKGQAARLVVSESTHLLVIWDLEADEEGEPMEDTVPFPKAMIQVMGEPAGAEIEFLGEIMPGRFDVLTDYDSIPIRFQGPGQKSTDDRAIKMMPRVKGGSALTRVRVGLLLAR